MKTEIKKLGEEVVCDAYVRSIHLNDPINLKNLCLKALKIADCHIVSEKAILFHQFESRNKHGDGVTGLIIIEESHFHISSWPEENYVQVNINTCGHIAKPLIAIGQLLHELQVIRSSLQVLERGVPKGVYQPK